MDLLIYEHLLYNYLFLPMEIIFLLRDGVLIKHKEKKWYMSHHRCFVTLDNHVKIICNDYCSLDGLIVINNVMIQSVYQDKHFGTILK
jgi:histidinol phosphatase-like enzyme